MTHEKTENFSRSDTQLDSVETSNHHHLHSRYFDFLVQNDTEELNAAINLYCQLDEIEGTHRAEQLLECRNYAWFTAHKTTGEVRIMSNACRLRWCPVCSEKKRQLIRHGVSEWIRKITKPKFLTLTCSHSILALSVQIEHLYKAFRLLRRHKFISDKIRGGIWFFQLKRSIKDSCWHPHLHIVLDSDYIDKRLLSLEWFQSTGNSYIIDIRAIKDPGKVADYVSRYCARPCKLSNFSQADRSEISTVLHGKRLCGKFGTGGECRFRPSPPEDASDWQRLGGWSDIVNYRQSCDTFREILKCYFNATPLEPSLRVHHVWPPCDDKLRPPVPPALSTNQFMFEEFVRR